MLFPEWRNESRESSPVWGQCKNTPFFSLARARAKGATSIPPFRKLEQVLSGKEVAVPE
jgi:hypothetical protein